MAYLLATRGLWHLPNPIHIKYHYFIMMYIRTNHCPTLIGAVSQAGHSLNARIVNELSIVNLLAQNISPGLVGHALKARSVHAAGGLGAFCGWVGGGGI